MALHLSPSLFESSRIDFARMRRERHRKLVEAMDRNDVDVLVLSNRPNVIYSTGAMTLLADSSREAYQPAVAVVLRDGSAPHLFTPYPEGVPPGFPREHVHPPLYPEFEDGVRGMAQALKAVAGPALNGKVAFDDYTAPMLVLLPELLPQARLVDPSPALTQARICKTRDEIECLKTAQAINDTAMYEVLAALRPGVRQAELSGLFLQRIMELGATGNHVDPIWMVAPERLQDGPLMLLEDLAFPLPSTDRVLREGDVVMVDTGIEYMGYASDFGRTWLCGLDREPVRRLRDQYKTWRDVSQAVREMARPGRTGGDVTRAALKAAGGRMPWLKQFYIVHGMGVDSAEPPLIGTSLGAEFDESIVLAPGMVMVIEPCIFVDGVGGYRSEDVVAVTEGEPEWISTFPYAPWDDAP